MRLTTNLEHGNEAPYFLWDEPLTVNQLRQRLAEGEMNERIRLAGKVLREARPAQALAAVTRAIATKGGGAVERAELEKLRARARRRLWTPVRARAAGAGSARRHQQRHHPGAGCWPPARDPAPPIHEAYVRGAPIDLAPAGFPTSGWPRP